MKKTLKFVFVFLFVFIFLESVNAETLYNYSCDYSFNEPASGNKISFRIKVVDLPDEYVKNADTMKTKTKDWNKYVIGYALYDGSYKKDNTPSKFDGKSKGGCSELKLFIDADERMDFIAKSIVDGNIICPKLNFVTKPLCWVTVYNSSEASERTPQHVEVKSIINTDGMNCYDSSSDLTPTRCSSPVSEDNKLFDENKKECTYTGTTFGVDTYFKLIYDKNNNTLQFDNLGHKFTVGDGTPTITENGNVFITDSELISKFKTSAESNRCPSNINCDCTTIFKNVCYFNKSDASCGSLVSNDGQKVDPETGNQGNGTSPDAPDLDIDTTVGSCSQILGPNLTKLVNFAIDTLKIVGAIITIVNGMVSLIPAIVSKDQDALKKAGKKCIYMAVVLALIFLLPLLAKVIGNMFDFDISCFVD